LVVVVAAGRNAATRRDSFRTFWPRVISAFAGSAEYGEAPNGKVMAAPPLIAYRRRTRLRASHHNNRPVEWFVE
jgi:hypothetical protein